MKPRYEVRSKAVWNDDGEQETAYEVLDLKTGEYIYTDTNYETASRYSN